MNQTGEKAKAATNGKWSQAQKEVEQGAAHMSESARKIYDQAVEAGSDFIAQANKTAGKVVREYPVYATLGGLCVGFLLGASLFGRRTQQ